ncbi:universal stress protein [Streptomyces mayteni]
MVRAAREAGRRRAGLRGPGAGAELVAPHTRPSGTTDAASAARLLAQVLAGRCERYPDVTVRQRVADGDPREALIEASGTAQPLVVGARGGGGFTKPLLDSVSQALVHHALCSVTVVRGGR